jgi:hypothetical protein
LEWQNESRTVLLHETADGFVNETLAFFPCPCRECCRVHNVTGTVTCKEGNVGALCAVCAADHYKRSDDGKCVACAQVNVKDDIPWPFLGAMVAFITFFLGSDARADWKRFRWLQRHIQGCRRHLVGKSKIVLSFFQIMLLSKTVYRVPFPRIFVDFMNKLAFLRFELFKLVPLRCIAPYDFHNILDAVMVVAVLMVLPPWVKVASEYGLFRTVKAWFARSERTSTVAVQIGACCRKAAPWRRAGVQQETAPAASALRKHASAATAQIGKINGCFTAETVIKWLLVLTYLVYPAVSSMLFQTFSCESISLGSRRSSPDALPPTRSRWLHQDYAIDCDDAGHKYYEGLAIAMIVVFAFGVPMLFWALLRLHRHNLMHANAQYLAFFFADYSAEHWYWEVIECFRKFVLTGLALFFGAQGSLLQTAISMGLMMIYIPVLIKLQPYKLPSDNHVALLVNVGLFFVLFSSLLLKVKTAFASTGRFEEGYSEDMLGYFLIVIALLIITAWVLSLLHDIREFNTRQSFRHEDSGELVVLPKLDETEGEESHIFVSHSQRDAGDQTAHIKKEIEKFISTAVIFTDVAAGRVERQLTEKAKLASAIKKSAVFLVFLTKTYFTRKWCVLELQQAIALKKHIVIIFDTNKLHGGMATLEELVNYAQGQKARSAEDKELGASNLFNHDVAGSTVCAELGNWVKACVSVVDGKLRVTTAVPSADTVGGGSGGGGGIKLMRVHDGRAAPSSKPCAGDAEGATEAFTAIGWYRFADWKLVALQLAVEDMLKVQEPTPWLRKGLERKLKLPVGRAQLTRAQSGQFHLAVSDAHPASKVIASKLAAFSATKLGVLRTASGRAAATKETCPCMLVVTGEGLVGNRAYQEDVRNAIDAGLCIVLVQDCTEQLQDTSDALLSRLAEDKGREFPFTEEHIRAIFNPISIRCQPTLLQGEKGQLSLFDESTLVQLERAVAAAQPYSARQWFACLRTPLRACMREGLCSRSNQSRRDRAVSWSVFRTKTVTIDFDDDNPLHAEDDNATAKGGGAVANPMRSSLAAGASGRTSTANPLHSSRVARESARAPVNTGALEQPVGMRTADGNLRSGRTSPKEDAFAVI